MTAKQISDATANQNEGANLEPLMVFSSDTHVGPRPEDLRPYCEKKYLRQFDEFASSESASVAVYKEMFLNTFSDAYRRGSHRNQQTEGHHDPHARLRDMDRDGVSGGVIFHNSLNGQPFPFDVMNTFGNSVPSAEERELVGVGRTIYNRWLSDFCSVEPERNVGLAQLPFWDIPAAIEELETAAESGLRGVNFPAPGTIGMAQPDEEEFDDFFAACAALDMTLATHIGALPPPASRNSGIISQTPAFHRFTLLDTTEWGLRTIRMLTLHGVFERHPNLKLIVTELPGNDWDGTNAKMDSVYYSPEIRKDSVLSKPPSEYTETNLWIGNSFQSRSEATGAIDIGRADRFLWGSDYPHPEGTWSCPQSDDEYPMTRLALANTYHGLPLDKVRLLAGENAIDCYPRLDRGALRKVAARIGPRVEEIMRPPDVDRKSLIDATGTLAFRTGGAWD